MNEEWKQDIYTNGKYSVSSFGRVKNANSGRIMKATISKKGYVRLSVMLPCGGRITAQVHRMVALAFIPNPLNLPQVNHIDGNKQNNKIDNLEWISNLENMRHAWKTGLRNKEKISLSLPRGEDSGLSKVSNKQAEEIRKSYYLNTVPQAKLALIYGVNQSTISRIINKKTYKEI